MATQTAPTASRPYDGPVYDSPVPGSYPPPPSGGPPGGDKYPRPSQQEQYSRPSEAEEYYRPSQTNPSSRPSQSDQYYRPSQPEQSSSSRPSQPDHKQSRPSQPDYPRPAQPADPSASYGGQSVYGGPPPAPVPSVSIHPPVEQMAGPAAYATPHSQQASLADAPRPTAALQPLTGAAQDLKSAKTSTQFAMREYVSLQRKRGRIEGPKSLELEEQIRAQGRILLGDLKTLRQEVGVVIKDGENHRWRNWLIGGAVATFIPAVKRIFRRSSSDKSESPTTNNTEYAFSRSKALLARIKDSVLGRNNFASIAFFVFAVLYVFSNEVSLLVAKTVSKRLKRLSAKIERGDTEVAEQDMKLLDGWRWRVLMWGQ